MKSVLPLEVALAFPQEDMDWMQNAFDEARRRRNLNSQAELAAVARAIVQTFQKHGRDGRKLLDAGLIAAI